MARTEVTLSQWAAVMGTRPNDCEYGCDDAHPVSRVSWNEACEYADRLTNLENEVRQRQDQPPLSSCYVRERDTWAWPAANRKCTGYRLPTEAEWEYFADIDAKTLYFFGDDPKLMCDFGNVFDETAKGAGILNAKTSVETPFYDCVDGYAYLAPVGSFAFNRWGLFDGQGNVGEQVWDREAQGGDSRVLRGSDFNDPIMTHRASDRRVIAPSDRRVDVGFRVVRSAVGQVSQG
ncbi:formylglycine-generating enzyme family protein [Nannocystis pusilla]|uniref:formylglycine-generating enzyme family protein n=1 Tax=Nannocystis pusilla TaxID=889268 RepID=UPI003B78CA37